MTDLPTTEDMPSRFGGLVTRIVLIVVVLVLATATLTFAARRQATQAAPVAAPVAHHAGVTGPDVEHQVYVCAGGARGAAGFAWRVGAGARGYAGYRVVSQSPAAGTRLVDTGAPTIVLHLARDPHYSTVGHSAESGSPYRGNRVQLADTVSNTLAPAPAAPVKHAAPKAKPAAKPVARPVARPAAKKPVVKK